MPLAAWFLVLLLVAGSITVIAAWAIGRRVLRLDARGAWLIGGVGAGLALSPIGFGAVFPSAHHGWIIGGAAHDRAASAIEARIEPESQSLRASGVSAVAADEHAHKLADAAREQRTLAAQQRAQRQSLRHGAAAGAGLVMLMLSAGRVGRGGRWSAFAAGAAASVFTVLAAAVVIRTVLGVPIEIALAGGAVVSAGAVLPRGGAARAFGIGALGVSCAVLIGTAGAGATLLPLLLALSWLVSGVLGMAGKSASRPTHRNTLAIAVLTGVVPALLLPSAGGDLDARSAVLIGAAVLFAGDAHLLAAWLGLKLFARPPWSARPMTVWLLVHGRGVPVCSLVLLALASLTGTIEPGSASGTALVLAIAAGSVSSEITRPAVTHAILTLRSGLTPP